MKRMAVFTEPNGSRFAVPAFDIHGVYQQTDPAKCRIVHQVFKDGEYTEASKTVVGTFDDIIARIEEHV